MRAAHPSSLHRTVTIGSAALLVMLGLFATAAPASAHDSLDPSRTTPAPESTVATMPDQITLAFSAALLTMSPQDTVVDVLSPSGSDVSEGAAVVDGAMVHQAVGEVAEAGAYTVNWHVVSSDGHPTEGTYTFTVESADTGAGAVAPENDETTTPPPAKGDVTPTPIKETPAATPIKETPAASSTPGAADGEGDDRSFGEVLPWILLGVTGIAIVGALIAILTSRGRGDDDDEDSGPDPTAQG